MTLSSPLHLPAHINVPPTGWISVKFDIGDFYKKICQENPNVAKNNNNNNNNNNKTLGTLHQDISTFYCCW
jgi:hypothetical protein